MAVMHVGKILLFALFCWRSTQKLREESRLLVCDEPGRQLEAEDVLDLGQHVLVHLIRQVSDRQKQVLHLRVRRVAAQDDVSGGGSHVFLVDPSILVVNSVHRLFHLQTTETIHLPL